MALPKGIAIYYQIRRLKDKVPHLWQSAFATVFFYLDVRTKKNKLGGRQKFDLPPIVRFQKIK